MEHDMTDIMVDLETMGTSPSDTGIIQLSAIKFNYETGEIGDCFDRCPMPLPRRRWDDATRDFWLGKNRKVYEGIVTRAEPGVQVFNDFDQWVLEGRNAEYRFWSKPLSFDWPFLASHYEQLGRTMPFHYRYARDMNSFIAALHGSAEHVSYEDIVPFEGDKHNALHDCAWQIDCLLHAKSKHVYATVVGDEI